MHRRSITGLWILWTAGASACEKGPMPPARMESREAAERSGSAVASATETDAPATAASARSERQRERDDMVDTQLVRRGIRSPAVLAAMRAVPRHRFVPAEATADAYGDHPLSIGHGVTISQPYVVALMSELAAIEPGDRVLEIGAGSGYQAAVLAELGAEVYTVEILEPLAEAARARLRELGYGDRVHLRVGDGARGWPEHAPYAAIVVTAAPPTLPPALKEQLALGGRLVAPVGGVDQSLVVVTRGRGGFTTRDHGAVRFVPMTGEAQR